MEESYKYFKENVLEKLKYLSFSFHMKVRLSSGKFNFLLRIHIKEGNRKLLNKLSN
jgi:hypothetical protein